MEMQQAHTLARKYVDEWNQHTERAPLWVSLAMPESPVNIPGVTFSNGGAPVAGMHQSIRAELIVLNPQLVPESFLSSFFHEYGHALYAASTPAEARNVVDSEVAAIRFSLEALEKEGFADLAAREVAAVLDMAVNEPYKSAVAKLTAHPLWIKYAHRRA